MITNQLLYQLSYTGNLAGRRGITAKRNTTKEAKGIANWEQGDGPGREEFSGILIAFRSHCKNSGCLDRPA